MGLSVITLPFKTKHPNGVRIRVYPGLLARILNRTLARGYALECPESMRKHPAQKFVYTIYFRGLCHFGTAPSLHEAIQDAISFVRE